VTGSAWVVSEDGRSCLLTHHAKLDKWLQLGGHADGESDIRSVALREAREESGLQQLAVLSTRGVDAPLDIDVHSIPAAGGEPAHRHYDVCFLVEAAAGQRLIRNRESKDLCWVETRRLRELTTEESVLRFDRRARKLLEGIS
jgi:8-oxo-dGTP pyrophosphatase MutT (NUDIX family)